jgi:hypothetical protein
MVNQPATTIACSVRNRTARRPKSAADRKQARQKLVISPKCFELLFETSSPRLPVLADFRHFSNLARLLQILLAWPSDSPPAGSGRQEMTFNLINLQQLAVSLVGAVFTASLFVSAAVGPVGQFI